MAKVKVKNKSELIQLSSEQAKNLKRKWLDPTTVKTNKVDLGDWVGEYGMILAIDFDDEKLRRQIDYVSRWDSYVERFVNLPPEKKAESLSKFKTDYFVASNFSKHPTLEDCEQAKKIQLNYFKQNPQALRVPKSEFKSLFKTSLSASNRLCGEG